MSDCIYKEKWLLDEVYGDKIPEEPGFSCYYNIVRAIRLYMKHGRNNSKIFFHADCDFDGIGTCYELFKYSLYYGFKGIGATINKEKVHGINMSHANYINKRNANGGEGKIDLFIVLDSSTNEIEAIKSCNCDVLVIDHHKVTTNELYGKTYDGHDYVIVNNTIQNPEFEQNKEELLQFSNKFENMQPHDGDPRASCGLVVYEFLRILSVCTRNEDMLENSRIIQWVGMTLFTDSVDTKTKRNIYYMTKSMYNFNIEPTLKVILNSVNKYLQFVTKSFINYSFTPLINKAIRAGHSGDALQIILNQPQNITQLAVYDVYQRDALFRAGITEDSEYNFYCKRLSDDVVHHNYYGYIAQRICSDFKKSAAVYRFLDNGKVKGSFRGRRIDIDYNGIFNTYYPESAQGHDGAFGFEMTEQELVNVMAVCGDLDSRNVEHTFMSIGNIPLALRGKYHIQNVDNFRRQQLLLKLAIGNSYVQSKDEIKILASASDIRLVKQNGKLFIYDVYGIECKAFEPITTPLAYIYAENSSVIECYLRNFK